MLINAIPTCFRFGIFQTSFYWMEIVGTYWCIQFGVRRERALGWNRKEARERDFKQKILVIFNEFSIYANFAILLFFIDFLDRSIEWLSKSLSQQLNNSNEFIVSSNPRMNGIKSSIKHSSYVSHFSCSCVYINVLNLMFFLSVQIQFSFIFEFAWGRFEFFSRFLINSSETRGKLVSIQFERCWWKMRVKQ